MKDKKQYNGFSQQEARLRGRAVEHPETYGWVQSILEIAHNKNGPLKTADDVEEPLIEEMRRLGGPPSTIGPSKPKSE